MLAPLQLSCLLLCFHHAAFPDTSHSCRLRDSFSGRNPSARGRARFGGALDAASLTGELTQLLALLMEPANSERQFWMVDWLWGVYRDALQPFLVLAGPATGSAAVSRFRECWACLPWRHATFHTASPGVRWGKRGQGGSPATIRMPHRCLSSFWHLRWQWITYQWPWATPTLQGAR